MQANDDRKEINWYLACITRNGKKKSDKKHKICKIKLVSNDRRSIKMIDVEMKQFSSTFKDITFESEQLIKHCGKVQLTTSQIIERLNRRFVFSMLFCCWISRVRNAPAHNVLIRFQHFVSIFAIVRSRHSCVHSFPNYSKFGWKFVIVWMIESDDG